MISGIALGFSADSLVRWFYPAPEVYLAHFPRVIDLFGGPAFEHGAAWRNEDCTAAAL